MVAAVWAVWVLTRGGSWWGPLHAFLAGTVLAAISGATQMFTITWAAARPPQARLTGLQRWLLIAGVGLVLVGIPNRSDLLVVAGAGAVGTSLLLLAISIMGTVSRSLLRRFDLSARFYLLALACGVVGVTLGAVIGTGAAGSLYTRMRAAHSHLNLVGLVGFTIIGTIPTFLPTVAHHRAVSGKEARIAWWMCAGAAAALGGGILAGPRLIGAGTTLAGLAALVMLTGILTRLWERGRLQLPFLQVAAGVTWLAGWAVAEGLSLLGGRPALVFAAATAAAVVAGVGQVLTGSLLYLLPVLVGPRLEGRFERTTDGRWVALGSVNLAGLALVLGQGAAAAILAAIWVGDFLRRLIRLLPTR